MELWYQLTFDPLNALVKLAMLLVLSMFAISSCVIAWKVMRRYLPDHHRLKPAWLAPGFVFFYIAPWFFYFFYAIAGYSLGYTGWGPDWITAWWCTMEQSIWWIVGAALQMQPESPLTFSRSGVVLFSVFMVLMGFVILAYIPKWRYRLLFIPITVVLAILVSYREAPTTAFDHILPESYASILAYSDTVIPEDEVYPPRFESSQRALGLFLFSIVLFGAPLVWVLKEVPRVATVFCILSMAVVALWPGDLSLDRPVEHTYFSEESMELDLMLQTFAELEAKGEQTEALAIANQIIDKLTSEGRLLSAVFCEDYSQYFSGYCETED